MLELIFNTISTIIIELAIIFMLKRLINRNPIINKNNILIIALVPLTQMILFYCHLQIINPILTIGLILFINIKMYKCNLKEGIRNTILVWCFSVIIDILMMLVVNHIDITNMTNEEIQLYKSLSSLGMSVILFLLANSKKFIKFISTIIKKISNIKRKNDLILLPVSAFFLTELIAYTNMNNTRLIIVTIIISFLFILVYTRLIITSYKSQELIKTNNILEKNNIVNREIITNYRILKHNIENNLRGVKTVSNKQGKQLIDEIIKEYNESVYIKYDINSMPNGINGLVMEKIYNYKDYEINLEIINRINDNILKSVGSKKYNIMCEALGIMVDNALESVVKSKEKVMLLHFSETKDYVKLIIANTFCGEINIDSLGTAEYTTKEKGHGLGLFSLLTKKQLQISTVIMNNVFKNTIKIKKLH